MKAVLTTLVLICSMNAVFSQGAYTNYLDSTSTWHTYGEGADGFGWQKLYMTTFFDGDTLINGQYYYKEYRIIYDTTYNSFAGGINVDTFYYGPAFMREDNTLKFLYYDTNSNTDIIAWDWQYFINALVNDSFPGLIGCTMDTIDSVTLGSQTLGRYKGNVVANMPRYLVEGIGEIGNPCGIGIESNNWIVCYKKQNDSIQFHSIDCGLFPPAQRSAHFTSTAAVENLSQKSFKIFPNPVDNVLKISVAENQFIQEIRILDLSGNTLLESVHNSSEVVLDTSMLPSGMYIVHLVGNDSIKEFQKIIKL